MHLSEHRRRAEPRPPVDEPLLEIVIEEDVVPRRGRWAAGVAAGASAAGAWRGGLEPSYPQRAAAARPAPDLVRTPPPPVLELGSAFGPSAIQNSVYSGLVSLVKVTAWVAAAVALGVIAYNSYHRPVGPGGGVEMASEQSGASRTGRRTQRIALQPVAEKEEPKAALSEVAAIPTVPASSASTGEQPSVEILEPPLSPEPAEVTPPAPADGAPRDATASAEDVLARASLDEGALLAAAAVERAAPLEALPEGSALAPPAAPSPEALAALARALEAAEAAVDAAPEAAVAAAEALRAAVANAAREVATGVEDAIARASAAAAEALPALPEGVPAPATAPRPSSAQVLASAAAAADAAGAAVEDASPAPVIAVPVAVPAEALAAAGGSGAATSGGSTPEVVIVSPEDFPGLPPAASAGTAPTPGAATSGARAEPTAAEMTALRERLDSLVAGLDASPTDQGKLFEAASIAYDLGDLELARRLYERLIELNPLDTRALNNLGVILLAAHELMPAEGHLKEALALEPTMAEAWLNLGNVHLARGDARLSELAYRSALRARPGYELARLHLARALERGGRFDDAAAEIEMLLAGTDLGLDRAEVEAVRGRIALERGRLDAAARSLEEALRLDPTRIGTRTDLAVCYLRLGERSKAVIELDRVIAERPDHAPAYTARAMARMAEGDYGAARTDLQRALELAPELADAHYNYGLLSERYGNYAFAIEAYERVLEVDPHHAPALTNLGRLYLVSAQKRDEAKTRRYAWAQQALEYLDRATFQSPELAQAHYNRGLALILLDRRVEAASALERYLDLLPPGDEKSRQLADILERLTRR